MSSLQLLEIAGIITIIGFQAYIFNQTWEKIKSYNSLFPNGDNFYIGKPLLLPKYWKQHPKDILKNLEIYMSQSRPKVIKSRILNEQGVVLSPEVYENDLREENDLVYCRDIKNDGTVKIINSINTYLIRNKGIAADFHLIKDIVERNTDACEDEINQTISLPLYLGLLGTFIGIVLGLLQISGVDFSGDTDALDNAISTLLSGVMIAMVASFVGLLLTIINTGHNFKNAKNEVLEGKNEFYTFIQTDLLPLLNQNINSTLYSLQNNLHKFNDEFKTNITGLTSVMGKNHDALIAQEKILTTLDSIDITKFAKANVTILEQLSFSVEKFEKFNQYLSQLDQMLAESRAFTVKINEMISRTDNFNELGERVLESFSSNKNLLEFLQQHYNSLDESSQMINNSVGKVHLVMDDTLENFRKFTEEKIKEVQHLVNLEMDNLNVNYPEKWKKLDNLAYLQSVSKDLNDLKMSNATQMEKLLTEVKNSNVLTEKINRERNENLLNKLKKWLVVNKLYTGKSKNEKNG